MDPQPGVWAVARIFFWKGGGWGGRGKENCSKLSPCMQSFNIMTAKSHFVLPNEEISLSINSNVIVHVIVVSIQNRSTGLPS